MWYGQVQEIYRHPKYLGVILDRSLTFKKHLQNCKAKVSTRNNILRKLISSQWGENPNTLKTSALALCYSAAEYASPVWSRSSHAKYLDPAQNDSCRIIAGCLKPTNTSCLYLRAGIAPPDMRREMISWRERCREMHDPSHTLYGSQAANQRLKSGKSVLDRTLLLTRSSEETRLELWKDWLRVSPPKPALNIEPAEEIASGNCPPLASWSYWKCLNRLRTGVGRSKSTLVQWSLYSGSTLRRCCIRRGHSRTPSMPTASNRMHAVRPLKQ